MRHLYTFYAQNVITMKRHYHSAFNQSYMEDNGLSILSIRAKTNQLDFREKKLKHTLLQSIVAKLHLAFDYVTLDPLLREYQLLTSNTSSPASNTKN